MFHKIDFRTRTWTPAAVGTDETTALFQVKKRERVLWAEAELLVAADAATDSTQTLGDGTDPDGYVTSANLDLETGTVGTTIDGTGAMLDASGKLYTADDTVDVVYGHGTTPGATAPVVRYTIAVIPAGR